MLTSSISNFGFNVQWTVDSWKSRCPSFSPRSQSAQKSNMTQNVLDLIDLTNLFISIALERCSWCHSGSSITVPSHPSNPEIALSDLHLSVKSVESVKSVHQSVQCCDATFILDDIILECLSACIHMIVCI